MTKKQLNSKHSKTNLYAHNLPMILSIGAILFASFSSIAQNLTTPQTKETCSIVDSIRNQLPIMTRTNGTVVAIESPVTPMIVITNVGDRGIQEVSPEILEMLKNTIMVDFKAFFGEPFVSLAQAAYNAGIPFAVHFVTASSPEGIKVSFSLTELETALNSDPRDNQQ
ncbi:MAG: hypothetical protein K2L22_09010 [Muribaculaceae bacterium]|nr:hypothetical protein [Muribaculaceae bacterium]